MATASEDSQHGAVATVAIVDACVVATVQDSVTKLFDDLENKVPLPVAVGPGVSVQITDDAGSVEVPRWLSGISSVINAVSPADVSGHDRDERAANAEYLQKVLKTAQLVKKGHVLIAGTPQRELTQELVLTFLLDAANALKPDKAKKATARQVHKSLENTWMKNYADMKRTAKGADIVVYLTKSMSVLMLLRSIKLAGMSGVNSMLPGECKGSGYKITVASTVASSSQWTKRLHVTIASHDTGANAACQLFLDSVSNSEMWEDNGDAIVKKQCTTFGVTCADIEAEHLNLKSEPRNCELLRLLLAKLLQTLAAVDGGNVHSLIKGVEISKQILTDDQVQCNEGNRPSLSAIMVAGCFINADRLFAVYQTNVYEIEGVSPLSDSDADVKPPCAIVVHDASRHCFQVGRLIAVGGAGDDKPTMASGSCKCLNWTCHGVLGLDGRCCAHLQLISL